LQRRLRISFFSTSDNILYFGSPLKLSKYVDGNAKVVLKITFTVNESLVDEVSYRVDDLHRKEL